MGKCPTFHLLGGQLSSGQLSGGQLSGGQLSGGQLSVPRIFLDSTLMYLEEVSREVVYF